MEREQIRQNIQELRFQRKEKNVPDAFLKGIYELIVESKVELNFLNKRSKGRRVAAIAKTLCILDSDQFLKSRYPKKLLDEVLYEEYLSAAQKYIEISVSDRQYSCAMMGMISLKDEEVQKKLTEDFKGACEQVPAQFGLTEEFVILKRACEDALCKKN